MNSSDIEDNLRAAREKTSESASDATDFVNRAESSLKATEDAAAEKAQHFNEHKEDALQKTEDTLQRAEDQISHYATDSIAFIRGSANQTQQALDQGLDVASDALRSGAANARIQYQRAYQRSQEFVETGVAHSQAGLDMAFDKLREGINYCRQYPNTSYAILGIGTLVLLPGVRRFMWRQSIGRLQSEEARFKSAELRATHLKQNVKFHSAEQQKLMERLTAAQEQYNHGLSKLKATNKQLQSLQSTVESTESKAESLVQDLRQLPSSQALKLRAEVAIDLAAIKSQRSALDKQVYRLSKKGF